MRTNIVFLFLTIGWICFIYSMSLANGETSSSLSSNFSEPVEDVVVDAYFGDDYNESDSVVIELRGFVHLLVRKSAHIFEYFVLFILSFCILRSKKSLIGGICLCLIVSSLDETLQTQISGRTGVYTDVFIDQIGTFLGFMLVSFIYLLRRKKYDY